MQPGDRRLARDAQDRDGIRRGRIEAGDHVGPRGTGGSDANADVAGGGPRITLGHMGGALDMAREHVRDAAALLHRRVQRVDRRARNAKGAGNAFLFEDEDGGVDCAHAGHGCSIPGVDPCSEVYCGRKGWIISISVH